MPFLYSLKRALTVNFLLVASLPVLFFGLINIYLVSSHQLEGVRDRNIVQARSIAEEVESFLLEVRADLQHVQQTITSGIILQPDSTDYFLAGMVRNSQFFESIYLLDSNYQVLHLGVLPELQSRRDDYVRLDFSGHQLFQDDEKVTGPVWSDTFVSLVTGEPSVTLGLPMPQGFLLGNIRLSSLGRLLQRYSAYGGVEVSILDDSGTLVAHNITSMAMQRVNFNDHPTVISAMEGIESTQEFKLGSKYYLESATRILTTGWVVWVGLDMHVVLAPIHNIRNLLIGFMVAAVLLACTIALLNVRRLMQPLTVLGQRAEQIAAGHYEFHFHPSGFSEIDTLANQIKSMSHAIKVREESIITNEQRFRDLVNSIDGIVWEMEYPSFRFLFVSKQAESLLGYPVHDWYEDRAFWGKKMHADDVEQARAYCQLMSEKHQDHDFEYRMIAADGRIVWIRDLVTVVVKENRPVRLLGVMIDVTAQKDLIDELSRSERNYREIFNSTSDAIFIHDAETGEILDVNQAMLNMFHCSYEEALVVGLEAFCQDISPYSLDEAKLKLQEAHEKGSCAFEWRSRKKTGELFWTEVNMRSAMIGNQQRIIAAVRDISYRKAAENELLKYRAHLEELVKERTAQLEAAQEELMQKGRLAVLGQLTATVSHEIRNPLGTVANALYFLKDSLDDEEHAHLARPLLLAERNVERCDNIISDLLDFSRQRKIQREPLAVDGWLAELLDELSFPEEVKCCWSLASQATILADSERLRRVMVNVITNALQALNETSNAGKTLEVRTRINGSRCEINVHDNGPGMSEEIMARIFEPMFSTKNFGVGLGVPIIKNILEGHGGGVEYFSEPGKGTTVAMWVPLESQSKS
ncbi:MAG: PAS domain S-box protein [Desulfuromonadales bacterium]|nr:PAS domain S-box protein [Desulfuromonadales bacterium]